MKNLTDVKKPKSEQKLSLTFFFPYRDISGVPVLFLRMAEFLSMNYGIETYVVDYHDGYMARTLKDRKNSVKIRFFEDGVPFEIGPETVLILQSILPYTLRSELKINNATRVVFWTFYHMNLVQTIIPLPLFRHIQARYILFHKLFMNTLMISLKHKLQEMVKYMDEKRSIFFQDGSTLKYTQERLDFKINNPIFLPVPCDDIMSNHKRNKVLDNKCSINVCWLGRIADFKTQILLYTIRKFSELARIKNIIIRFHIIGEGADESLVDEMNVEHDSFKIIHEGVISGENLDRFLLDKIDVLVAMGTSALEGAKLGVPTVLLDFSYGNVPEGYRFRMLFESEYYGLADLIDDSHIETGNKSLEQIIENIQVKYSDLSEKTFDYCARNHSISSVCEKFMSALEEATFHYGDFNPEILKRGWIRKMYELVREK